MIERCVKRAVIALLLITFLPVLAGCSTFRLQQTYPQVPFQNGATRLKIPRKTNQSSDGLIVDCAYFSIRSYYDYLMFLQFADPPETFVTYEKLNKIGEFDMISFKTWVMFGDFEAYRYYLNSPDGTAICVDIVPSDAAEWYDDSEFLTETIPERLINPNNLSQLSEQSTGVYNWRGIEYVYSYGKLQYVQFHIFGNRYQVSASSGNNGDGNFYAQLLNTKIAETALLQVFPDFVPEGGAAE